VPGAGWAGTDPEGADTHIPVLAGDVFDQLQLPRRRNAGYRHRSAGIRQPDAMSGALDQLNAQRAFKVLHLLGHGPLGQVSRGRCPRDAVGAGDREESPNLLETEGRTAHR